MTRNNLVVLVGMFLILLVMWFLKSANDTKRTLTTLTSSAAVASRIAPAIPASSAPSTTTSNSVATKTTETLPSLQARLATEQERLEEQRLALAELQARQASQVPVAAYGQQMSRNQEQIRDLGEDLRDVRHLETRIEATANQSLRSQESTAQLRLLQMDEDIRVVEAELQSTLGLIATWPNNVRGGVTPQNRLQELQATQAIQQARLVGLRDQRVEAVAAAAQQTQAIQSWSTQSRDQLARGQNEIQAQIVVLREEIQRLQGARDQSQASVLSLSSQVSQVQKNIDAQTQQVQSMRQEMQNRQ